ncbi:MAG TPA: cupredoxin domain-containing protein [Anaerolineae bacterium]
MKRAVGLICAVFTTAATSADYTVTMAGMNYQPASLQVKIGDVIRFVNDDGANHEVLIPTKGFGADLGLQKSGTRVELKMQKAGTFEVECVLHPHMLMKINVTE